MKFKYFIIVIIIHICFSSLLFFLFLKAEQKYIDMHMTNGNQSIWIIQKCHILCNKKCVCVFHSTSKTKKNLECKREVRRRHKIVTCKIHAVNNRCSADYLNGNHCCYCNILIYILNDFLRVIYIFRLYCTFNMKRKSVGEREKKLQ